MHDGPGRHPEGFPKPWLQGLVNSPLYLFQARKWHMNMNFFVRLALGRPRVCPGDFTEFVPGTNPVKTWDKPGFSPYFTQWKPDFTGFVPGTIPGTKGGTESLCEKIFMCLFSLAIVFPEKR